MSLNSAAILGHPLYFDEELGASEAGTICGLMGCSGLARGTKRYQKCQKKSIQESCINIWKNEASTRADENTKTFKHHQNTLLPNRKKHAGLEASNESVNSAAVLGHQSYFDKELGASRGSRICVPMGCSGLGQSSSKK